MSDLRDLAVRFFGVWLLFGASASMAQIVVSPGDTQGWTERASNTGTLGVGPADQQGGTGSLSMITTGSGGDIVKVARIPLITIGDIASISWDVYTDSAADYPRPQLEYYELGGRAGTLIYVASNTVVPINAWTSITVDDNDLFRSSEAGANPPQTLAAWQGELGGVLMNFFQLGYGSTTGSTTLNANIDFVELNGTTWDFEAVPPVEPPPPSESVTVTPAMLGGWFEKGVNPGVIPGSLALSPTSPAGNPLAPGALELTLDGVDDQIVNAARIPVTLLTDISEISWSASSNSTALPVAKVEYFGVLSGRSGTLVPVQPAYPGDGSWVTLDGLTLQWVTTEAGFPSSQTFAEWQAELGGVFVNFFSVGIGSSGATAPAAVAYIDQVVLGTARSITTWDFEGDAPLPPEPSLTSTTITSSAPNPSAIGEAVTISYQVAVVSPGVGTPTGTVSVTDGVTRAVLCTGTAAAGSCSASFAAAGSVSLVASFASDDTGYADSISDSFVHTVGAAPAATTTIITSSAPNPSDIGETVAISYQVAVVPPGVGTPTGTVSVTDGVTRAVLCTGTAAAGSCSASFAAAGSVGLVASFTSNVTDYTDSTSGAFAHTVADPATGPTPPPGGSAPVPTPLPPWMLAMLAVLMVTVVYRARRQSL
ncbi:MAG: Ig-like domain-containing protein [Halioglobus sp.]